MGQPWRPFCLFSVFLKTNFTEQAIGVSRIQTRIIGAEGEHADHLTTTTVSDSVCYVRT